MSDPAVRPISRSRAMRPILPALAAACALALPVSPAAALDLHDIGQVPAPPNATMMLYSPQAGALVLKTAANTVVVVDIQSGTPTTRLPHWQFTDIAMSPSGLYAFAADYGGENIGYGTPLNTSYVHRVDLASRTWGERTAYIAGNVEAVSDTQVILKSLDQWVTFTNNGWGVGTALVPLNTTGCCWGPGYYAGVYDGDFRYDFRTGRLLHGNAGSSSQEIQAFVVSGNDFYRQESSGTYGSAQGYGGTIVLASDGSAFYYGRLQVDNLDVAHNTHVFPERILAANGHLALGSSSYYDARSGAQLGSLPFPASVYAMNPQGDDFWALDPSTATVHHFVPDVFTATSVSSSLDPSVAGQPVTFTARVTSSSGAPAGTVTFLDGFTPIASAALSAGTASYTTPALSLGSHAITASYGGSAGFGESVSLPLTQSVLATPPDFHDIDQFPVTAGAAMMIYSPQNNALVLKNNASAVAVVDIASRASTTRMAYSWFKDISLSPGGRYAFAADYGGENIGYGTPASTHYVHRIDLLNGTWDVRTAYIAGNIQAVSDTQVILKSLDQWVSFTNNAWGTGTALVPLSTGGGVYDGNFRYDFRTSRLLHGNFNSSSQELQAFSIVNNEFVRQEGSGTYGSAQGYGGTLALATDGSALYYGKLQVDPLNVAHNLRVFPELIYAATGNLAFGNGTYYDARTGALLGSLPFQTTVFALNPQGADFWAFDPATSTVHHFAPGAPTATAVVSSANPSGAGKPVTFTATVTSLSGSPDGTVTFKDGSTALGNASLASGVASFETSALSLGSHAITAVYLGSGGYSQSTSPPLTQSVLALPKLTVTKVVVNDNGGTRRVSDFPLFVDEVQVLSGARNSYDPGAHTVSETPNPGYAPAIGGDCSANGSITLGLGDVKACTITNDDIAPKLTVTKVVVNNNGGTKQAGDFPLFVDGVRVTSGVQKTFNAGTHTVSETSLPNYAATFSGDCAAGGTVVLNPGDVKACTITNDDLQPPDLTVSVLSAPASAAPGSTISLTETTMDLVAAGAAGASTTRFYLSANSTWDASDTPIGSRPVPPLLPGASSPSASSVTIPANTATATWYLIARADADGNLLESNEANNTRSVLIKISPPDLVVSYVAAPATSGPGLTISVTDTTRNQGGGPAGPSTTKLYLSANAFWEAGDTLLASRSIPALGPGVASTAATTVTIPAGTAAATWRIIAKSDADGAVSEANEGNNTASDAIVIGPDLVESALSAPTTGGAGLPITITDTVKNQGGSPASASTTKFYLSADAAFSAGDTYLGSRGVGSLNPGASSPGSTTVTIPSGTPVGSYYIVAVSDAAGAVAEADETNNTRAVSIKLSPDLIVSVLTVPASTAAGAAIKVSDTTRNQGQGSAAATTTTFYLSTNATYEAGDILLASRGVPILASGAANSVTTTVTIPAGTPAGAYYILAVSDSSGAVAESNESNNITARAISVTP